MQHKSAALKIKAADDASGTFTGLASVFDNVDCDGDIVRRGAFTKSLDSGTPIPVIWAHKADDPRNFVGDVVEAKETDEGLEVVGKLDLDSDFGSAAFKNIKGRRVSGLSIGYMIRDQVKTAAGNELLDVELVEVSIVARGANPAALISSVKSSAGADITESLRTLVARARVAAKAEGTTMTDDKAGEQQFVKGRDQQLQLAKVIIDAATELQRDLTEEEAAQVGKHLDEADRFEKMLTSWRRSADVRAAFEARSPGVTVMRDGEPVPGSHPDLGGSLALTGTHAKELSRKIIDKMPRDAAGTKALASGVQTTSIVMLPQVVPTGRPATSVLDLLPARMVAPSYSFLKQSARGLAAAPVPAGSAKPVSTISVVGVQNRLRVVAHVSEQIDHYLLSDNSNLESFVNEEMVYGLRTAVENEVIGGDGTAEHFTGILNTSGVQTSAFSTDALTSIRKGLTALEISGYSAGLIVARPDLWESIELLVATTTAVAYQGVPIDSVTRTLFGVPVVLAVATGLPAKTALIIGDGAVTVDHDNAIDVKWSDAVGTDFTTNAVRCRVEGRFGVSVNQPAACVKVSTAA